MHINKSLIDRALDMPSVNENAVMMYRRLISLIDQYNLLARDRGLPIKSIPSYNTHMNHTLLSRLIGGIIKDIDRVKNIKETEKPPKTARNVEFTAGIITEFPALSAWKDEGLWYYIQDGDNICVYGDINAMISKINGSTELILDYSDMPYELLVDKNGNELKVNSYTVSGELIGVSGISLGLFGAHMNADWNNTINELSSLTLQNWTNRNVTDMSYVFAEGGHFETLNLRRFNTSSVTNMTGMFAGCGILQSLTLGDKFDTSQVTIMEYMFYGCTILTTLRLRDNFNTSKVTNMSSMFSECAALSSMSLYKASNSIIKELPSATWTVNNNDGSESIGTVTVSEGTSATWDPLDLPDQWEDNSPWTLSRNIQSP